MDSVGYPTQHQQVDQAVTGPAPATAPSSDLVAVGPPILWPHDLAYSPPHANFALARQPLMHAHSGLNSMGEVEVGEA